MKPSLSEIFRKNQYTHYFTDHALLASDYMLHRGIKFKGFNKFVRFEEDFIWLDPRILRPGSQRSILGVEAHFNDSYEVQIVLCYKDGSTIESSFEKSQSTNSTYRINFSLKASKEGLDCFIVRWKKPLHWEKHPSFITNEVIGNIRKEVANMAEKTPEHPYWLMGLDFKNKDFEKVLRWNPDKAVSLDFWYCWSLKPYKTFREMLISNLNHVFSLRKKNIMIKDLMDKKLYLVWDPTKPEMIENTRIESLWESESQCGALFLWKIKVVWALIKSKASSNPIYFWDSLKLP